jgi:hypothetical protein
MMGDCAAITANPESLMKVWGYFHLFFVFQAALSVQK